MITQISLGRSLAYRQSAMLKSEGRRRNRNTHWAHSYAAEQHSGMGQLDVASMRQPAHSRPLVTAKSPLPIHCCQIIAEQHNNGQFASGTTHSGHPDELYQ